MAETISNENITTKSSVTKVIKTHTTPTTAMPTKSSPKNAEENTCVTTSELINPLSEEEIAEMETEISHYEYPQAASIEALKIVQKYRGWVSDESLRAVARLLHMSAEQLDGVATFYSLIFRRPVGENVLMVCDSISCWMLGGEHVRDRIRSVLGIEYGETTPDNKFTLLPVTCQGACDCAPVMLKNMHLHTHLTPDNVEQLLQDPSSETATNHQFSEG